MREDISGRCRKVNRIGMAEERIKEDVERQIKNKEERMTETKAW